MSVNVTYNNPKMYDCVVNDIGTYILPIGRGSFPNLFKPKAIMGEGEPKFSLSLILPQASRPGLATLDKHIKKIATEKWSADKAKRIKYPILNNKEKAKDAALAEDFPYLIRMTSNRRPPVVFGNLSPCEEDQEQEVYAGRWMRVSARLYTWERQTGLGVSLGLSSVQLLDHDDRLSGAGGDPQKEFKDFVTNDGPSPGGSYHGNGAAEADGEFGLFN